MKKISVLLALLLFCFSCAEIQRPELSKIEQAKLNCEAYTDWYEATHNALVNFTTNTDADTKKIIIEKVNPNMNLLKELIKQYINITMAAEKTGEYNVQLVILEAQITDLLNKIGSVLAAYGVFN